MPGHHARCRLSDEKPAVGLSTPDHPRTDAATQTTKGTPEELEELRALNAEKANELVGSVRMYCDYRNCFDRFGNPAGRVHLRRIDARRLLGHYRWVNFLRGVQNREVVRAVVNQLHKLRYFQGAQSAEQ